MSQVKCPHCDEFIGKLKAETIGVFNESLHIDTYTQALCCDKCMKIIQVIPIEKRLA